MCILFFVILKTMALLKYGFVQSIIIKKFGLRGKYVDNWRHSYRVFVPCLNDANGGMLIMVRIEFFGAWKDEDMQTVRDVTVTGIEKNLKISVLPAYFEEEYSLMEENSLAFSENCMRNEKIAPVECGEAEQRMSGVKSRSRCFRRGTGVCGGRLRRRSRKILR